MPQALKILIPVAFVVIIVGIIIAVVLNQNSGGGTATPPPNTTGGTGGTPRATNTPEPPTAEPIPVIEVVVAVQEIARGMEIPPNAVELRPIPEPAAAIQVVRDLELVIGKIARTDIFIEQPILTNMLAENLTGIASSGSDAAAVLPPNRVAVAVPIDRITSVAYAIQPGDRVDIIVSMLFVDVDPDFQSIEPNSFIPYNVERDGDKVTYTPVGEAIPGSFETRQGALGDIIVGVTSPSETQRPRLVTQRTVQDALVVWLGEFPRDGKIFGIPATPTPIPPTATPAAAQQSGQQARPTAIPSPTIPPRPDLITLGVTPQDAVVLTYFVEAGLPVTFALRSAQSTSQAPTDAVSLDYIMNRYSIELPGKRPFALEPAIRSIRELFVGNRISLTGAR